MIKVTPTALETYRLYKTFDWMTLEKCIESLTGKFVGNEATMTGEAFHVITESIKGVKIDHDVTVEHTETGPVFSYHGYQFDGNDMERFASSLPDQYVPEVAGKIEIDGVLLRGRVDGLDAITAHDIKTSLKAIKADKYDDSFQWRSYLPMFGCSVFHYHLVQLGKNRQTGVHEIRQYDMTTYFDYPNLMDDLRSHIHDFIGFAESQNIIDFFTIKRQPK